MTLQYSVTLRNNQLDEVESTLGTSPVMQLRTGAPPADCATADTGALVCSITLPSDWLSAAAAGVKSLLGTWSGTASGTGVVAHFRIKDSGLVTTHMQGTVLEVGGDLTIDNNDVNTGQTVTVGTFAITAGNA